MMSARETALSVLHEIETEGAYSNIALKKALNKSELNAKDKALVTELVQGVVKYKKRLDYQIQKTSTVRMKKISPWILCILRMGLYQLQFLDRIPDSAAVNESVKLAAKYGHAGSKGFVNALLRKGKEPVPVNESDRITELAIRYSYPEWMVERFSKIIEDDRLERFLDAGNLAPPLFARMNTRKEERELLSLTVSQTAPWAWELSGGIDPAFADGCYTVQDAASQLVAFALDPKPGMRVLDVCAAPGGKATHIAEMMKDDGEVVACDIHAHKIELIRAAADRLGISVIRPTENDATVHNDELGLFDRVLADVPCSGLGIIRRKPDIKWNRKEEDILELAQIGQKILSASADYLKPGGVLVYSTCTLTYEENSENKERFLSNHPEFRLDAFGETFPLKEYRDKAEITLYPDMYGTDGFYICRMIKVR